MRFELTTPTLARLCSTPELRPLGGPALRLPERQPALQGGYIPAHPGFASVWSHKMFGFFKPDRLRGVFRPEPAKHLAPPARLLYQKAASRWPCGRADPAGSRALGGCPRVPIV